MPPISTSAFLTNAALIYEDKEALEHMLRTSCSLESLHCWRKRDSVTQFHAKAYEDCKEIAGPSRRWFYECL